MTRLVELPNGPALRGDALRSMLTVERQHDGKYLVDLRDAKANVWWVVIVHPSGASEISKTALVDEGGNGSSKALERSRD